MRVLYLTKRWSHHTDSGGYDQLAHNNGNREIKRVSCRGFTLRCLRAVWRRSYHVSPNITDYTFEDFLAEHKALAASWIMREDILHALYGDEQLAILLRFKSLLPCPIVATFHLPTWRVVERFKRKELDELRRLDGAIVVSTAQLPAFYEWLGEDKVVYIPHGIDIRVFHPPSSHDDSEVLRLLFVGTHMRDFALAHRVIDRCMADRMKVHFDIVTSSCFFNHFTGCDGITLHSAISEEELVALYQAADATFLPVTDATANNAVLESLACGTPIITSDVGGMRDYVGSSTGWLLPASNTDAAIDLIQQLSHSRSALVPKRRGGSRTSGEILLGAGSTGMLCGLRESLVERPIPQGAARVRHERDESIRTVCLQLINGGIFPERDGRETDSVQVSRKWCSASETPAPGAFPRPVYRGAHQCVQT